jgi:hypothetical protein
VRDGVRDGVSVRVRVDVRVGVREGVKVNVIDGVRVAVSVLVAVGVLVGVSDGVSVTVGEGMMYSVPEGMGVEDGTRVPITSVATVPTGVQVVAIRWGVADEVGRTSRAGRVGIGKGFKLLEGSLKMVAKTTTVTIVANTNRIASTSQTLIRIPHSPFRYNRQLFSHLSV